ncbi:MAG: ABC transporter ATP-binding protein [Ilumatobacteraceae bacterium]
MNTLDVSRLSVRFGERVVVDELSFEVGRGERLGIVGESGSGKTLTALAILDLLPDAARVAGTVTWEGVTLPVGNDQAMSRLRGSRIGMVFQEPLTALNPLMQVWKQIAIPLMLHTNCTRAEARARAAEWCARVGLPEHAASAYPHQLSGGQRQRVGIALALCGKPSLLIADEPTSALDVTVQREILDLLGEITTETKTSLIFVSHDLAVVSEMTDRVLVMQRGSKVEEGATTSVFNDPHHEYTQRLVGSAKRSSLALRRLIGESP